MKMIVGTLNFITVDNTIIESIDQFSDNQNYTNIFKKYIAKTNLEEFITRTSLNRLKQSEKSNMAREITYRVYLILS